MGTQNCRIFRAVCHAARCGRLILSTRGLAGDGTRAGCETVFTVIYSESMRSINAPIESTLTSAGGDAAVSRGSPA